MLESTDKLTQPVVKALGFKEITVAEGRTLGRFMAMLKDKHGNDPKSAFMGFIKEVLTDD